MEVKFDWKVVLAAVFLAVLILNYGNFSHSQSVYPRIFSAQGWAKYRTFDVSTSGVIEFNVPIESGMQPSGSDIVVTDSEGRVLRYVAWGGYPVPYRSVYRYTMSSSSSIYDVVPFLVSVPYGAGFYNVDWNYVSAIRFRNGVFPFAGTQFYVGVGGVESPYTFQMDVNFLDYQYLASHLYSFSTNVFAPVDGRVEEYTPITKAVCEPDGTRCYVLGGRYTGACVPEYIGIFAWDGTKYKIVERYRLDVSSPGTFPFIKDGRIYFIHVWDSRCRDGYGTDVSPKSSRYTGISILEWVGEGSTSVVHATGRLPYWDEVASYGYNPEYYPITLRYLNLDTGDAYFSSSTDYYHHGYLYPLVVFLDYNIYSNVVKGYRVIDLPAYGVPVRNPGIVYSSVLMVDKNNDLVYLSVMYLDNEYRYRGLVVVLDLSSYDVVGVYDMPAGFSRSVYVRRYDGSYISIGYHGGDYRLSGYSFSFGPSGVTASILKDRLGVGSDGGHRIYAGPIVEVEKGKFMIFYTTVTFTPGRCDYSMPQALSYLSPDGQWVDVAPVNNRSCSAGNFYVFKLANGGYAVFGQIGGGGAELYGALIDSSYFVPIRVDVFGSPTLTSEYVEPEQSDVVHVRADIPSPGTYYLFYGSRGSWPHYHPFDKGAGVVVSFSDPNDVNVLPSRLSLSAAADENDVVVSAELLDPDSDSPLVSDCIINGAYMGDVGEHHSYTFTYSPAISISLDCYAFMRTEHHIYGVLFPDYEGVDEPTPFSVPSEVVVGSSVSVYSDVNGLVCAYSFSRPNAGLEVNGSAVFLSDAKVVDGGSFTAPDRSGSIYVVCSSPGRDPAVKEVKVKAPASAGGGAPPAHKEASPGEVGHAPLVQPASPIPLGGVFLGGVFVLLLLLMMSRR